MAKNGWKGVSVSLGTKPGFVQFAFGDKPGEEVRQDLKANGFRFNPQSLLWWGHRDRVQARWGVTLPADSRKAPKGKRGRADEPKDSPKAKGRRAAPAEPEVAAAGHGIAERLDKIVDALVGLNSKVERLGARVSALEGPGPEAESDDE